MTNWGAWNPFARRESHTNQSIIAYKVLTLLTWILAVATSIYYTVDEPKDGFAIRQRIWDLNDLYRTAFTLDSTIATIYWIIIFLLQVGYVSRLFSKNPEHVTAAANVGSHFILNNLLHFAFVMLFVRSHFIWAEVIQVINFLNLTNLYLQHRGGPALVHIPVAAGPLAWAYVALFWNGALMLRHPAHFVPRVVGNVFVWSIPTFGFFCLIVFQDWAIGLCLSVLLASLGVSQFLDKTIALQWIFAFVSMGLVFVGSVAVAQRSYVRSRSVAPADQERAPLLTDDA